jgi:hypothetical protein
MPKQLPPSSPEELVFNDQPPFLYDRTARKSAGGATLNLIAYHEGGRRYCIDVTAGRAEVFSVIDATGVSRPMTQREAKRALDTVKRDLFDVVMARLEGAAEKIPELGRRTPHALLPASVPSPAALRVALGLRLEDMEGVYKANATKLEKDRHKSQIATLGRYFEGLGGRLVLKAVFNGRAFAISGLRLAGGEEPSSPLRRARHEGKLTLRSMAARAGFNQDSVFRMEQKNANPFLPNLERYLEAAGGSLAAEVVFGDGVRVGVDRLSTRVPKPLAQPSPAVRKEEACSPSSSPTSNGSRPSI